MGGRFRVGRFYTVANNGPKVSNLTVGPTQSIVLPLHKRRVPHFLWEQRRATGDTLHQLNRGRFIQSSAPRLGVPHHIILKCKNNMKKNTKYNKLPFQATTKNTRILQATMATLESLTNTVHLKEMAMNEVLVHLLDEDGDGVVLCLEYDENGELQKTFSSVDEYYEDTIEVELEDEEEDTALFDEDYYGGRTDFTVTVLDEVSEKEAISEEYDEVFHNSESKPPLLN